MSSDIRQTVISGLPYPITSVVGADITLDAFIGDTEFTVDLKGEHHLVRGNGSLHGDHVRFHEKDRLGGKDVRVWHVSAGADGRYQAEAISAF